MEYEITKENGIYEIKIRLECEFDYPTAHIRIRARSNEFDDLEIITEYQEDIVPEMILKKIKECIHNQEERFEKYKHVMNRVDTMIKSGSI